MSQKFTKGFHESSDEDEDEDQAEKDGESAAGDTCPICGYFNETPAEDTCTHYRAWSWDGTLVCSGAAEDLNTAWGEACELVAANGRDPDLERFLKGDARASTTLSHLIHLADENKSFLEVLVEVADAQMGGGWSTKGMLGGSGFNVYVEKDDELIAATRWYRSLIDKAARTLR